MTLAGVVLLDLLALAFVVWILTLVYRGRLYVGYGVILVAALVVLAAIASVPMLRRGIDGVLEQLFGAAGPLIVALSFVSLLLVYILTQVTIVSNRLVTVVQDLAIREASGAVPRAPGVAEREISPRAEDERTPSSRRTG